MTMQNGELAKASLAIFENGRQESPVYFKFNPTGYSLSKSNTWKAVEIVGYDVPTSQFVGGGPTTLKLDLLFDTYEDQKDVRTAYTDAIIKLTKIHPKTEDAKTGTGRPPICLFSWGKDFTFPAVITALSVEYTLFLSDGTPVRARMSITLQECQDPKPPRQNPTSQGVLGHKVYMIKPGDTIDWIAYSEYNDPTAWRFIADTNGLDNPRDLKPGQVLAIQPLES